MIEIHSIYSADISYRKFEFPEYNLTIELKINNPHRTLLDGHSFYPAAVPTIRICLKVDLADICW